MLRGVLAERRLAVLAAVVSGSIGSVAVALADASPGYAAAAAAQGRPPASGGLQSRAVDPVPPAPPRHPALRPLAKSAWLTLTNPPPFSPGEMFQLTDGQVLVQEENPSNASGTGNWWVLTPDSSGSYQDGTWSQAQSLPSGYAPQYYASAVLPDGRLVIEGGEYNGTNEAVWTNQGAIYDPVANTWTAIEPPEGGFGEWERIGDAPSSVLADGQFMFGASGYSETIAQAILDPGTLTWTGTGAGKADGNGEEGWSLLPDGDLLTVDTQDTPNSELYDPSTGTWSSAGDTPADLADSEDEMGPQVLMPNGSVLSTGASGANALYNTSTGRWSAAPSFPVIEGQQYDIADGPAAVLPDGNVLLDASPGVYNTPVQFFLYKAKTGKLAKASNPPNAASTSSFYGFMLMLPNGQLMYNDRYGDMVLYTAGGKAQKAWAPAVTSVPATLAAGSSYTLSGTQLNGLTQDSAYGDDYQDATNYPLVRITNTATKQVAYARTYGMTSMSVTPGQSSSVQFTVPAAIGSGASTLVVVANGIPSAKVKVTITP